MSGELEQDFLIQDKDKKGALVHAKMTFDQGNATFQLLTELDLLPFESFKTPMTVYGNVVEASRGETVTSEVLGNGDSADRASAFKLGRSRSRISPAPGTETGVQSTLTVRVAGVAWTEVEELLRSRGRRTKSTSCERTTRRRRSSRSATACTARGCRRA